MSVTEEMKEVKIATITYNYKTETYSIWITPPLTSDEIKKILQKLIENDLKPTKV